MDKILSTKTTVNLLSEHNDEQIRQIESHLKALLSLTSNDIIEAEKITRVLDEIELMHRHEKLLKHQYEIWQGKDGNWYTYLPDDQRGRILRKRKTQKDIEDVVIKYIEVQENNPTVKEVFDQWLSGKMQREEIEKSTRDRYIRQFNQCFVNFGKRKIKCVDEYDIEEFILNSINEYDLTRKGYANLRTLIYGIFKFAKKRKYISYSITDIVNDIEISKKLFRRVIHTDEEQVFTEDELPAVIDYLENNQNIYNLGLLLLFKTGLRIGELAALKKCDVSGNKIYVNRTEIHYKSDKGYHVYEVRDFPKTDAGIREVVIPQNAVWILSKIMKLNPFGEFLFQENGKRIKTYSFRSRLRTVCARTKAVNKSPHKIRKTYGTILIDNGVAESMVIAQMGHTDIRTTKEHYYHNRKSNCKKTEILNHVIGL